MINSWLKAVKSLSLLILNSSFLPPLPPFSLSTFNHSYLFEFLLAASLKAPVLTLKACAASLVSKKYTILILAEAH
ncbi:hypothetical protein CCIPSID_1080 [Campylobacter coli IPSID-1]|nr:hypothetical protein CCIPSID_1080 [Campylobacter coli IPSID-1]